MQALRYALAIAAIGLATGAAAQDDAIRLRMKFAYPAEALQAGHQGTVMVAETVQPDGTLTDVRVSESSRSPILDKAALDLAAAATIDPADRPRKPVKTYAEFPFYRMSLVSPAAGLARLTCAQFVADVRWFEQAWPERRRQDVNDYQAVLGPLMLAGLGNKAMPAILETGRSIQRTRARLDQTLDACAAAPAAMFMATLAQVPDAGATSPP